MLNPVLAVKILRNPFLVEVKNYDKSNSEYDASKDNERSENDAKRNDEKCG